MDLLRSPLLMALFLFVAGLAGCIGDGDDVEEIDTPVIDESMEMDNMTSLGPIDAPEWNTTQWWAHHTYRGLDDATGTHFNVIVVSTEGGYKVAPESTDLAMQEANEDVWDVGMFSASDLSTTRGGEAWKWYDWPLEQNKSWEQSIDILGASYDLTFTVTYNESLRTAQGGLEGFDITGVTADNFTALSYDYVPEMEWFSDLELYDPLGSAEDPIYAIMNMGFGEGRTGEYVEVQVESVLDYSNSINASAPTNDLSATFTVPEGANELVGHVIVSAETGAATLQLTDPGQGTEDYTVNPPGGTIDEAVSIGNPEAGEWSLLFAGVGPEVWTSLQLTAVVETVGTY